jgi:ParB family chromosome partitioning protein
MADKPKGRWAESASGYRPTSAPAKRATRPWHVDVAAGTAASEAEREAPLAWARTLPTDQIEADPEQPRRTFDDAAIGELAASLREHGVLQPLVVRRRADGAGYVVVAGERRLRAARLAGLAEVPCMVLAGDSLRDARLAQLAENLQREDLAPIEEAHAVARLAEVEGLTHDELARRLGKSPAYISRIFAVSRIETGDYDEISSAKPTMSILYAFAQLPAGSDVRRRAATIIREGGTVKEVEALRGRGARRTKTAAPKRGRPASATAPLEALRRAARALDRLDARAVARMTDDDRLALVEAHLEVARRAVALCGEDRDLADAVRRLERALTREFDARSSRSAGRAGRAGRKAASSRPR